MKRRGTFLIWTGLLLLAAALGLAGYNAYEARHADKAAAQVLEELLPAVPSPVPSTAPTESAPSEVEYPDYVLDPGRDMPVLTVDGADYIGVLSVPELGLELPIQSEWDYDKLRNTPCRYIGTAYQSDFVIAAHNYTRHFGRLHELSLGSTVEFTDMDGNLFCYEVREITTLSPTSIEEMKESGYDLTLFTCTVGGRSRITVRCEKTA